MSLHLTHNRHMLYVDNRTCFNYKKVVYLQWKRTLLLLPFVCSRWLPAFPIAILSRVTFLPVSGMFYPDSWLSFSPLSCVDACQHHLHLQYKVVRAFNHTHEITIIIQTTRLAPDVPLEDHMLRNPQSIPAIDLCYVGIPFWVRRLEHRFPQLLLLSRCEYQFRQVAHIPQSLFVALQP